ncbi:glycosyltransferase family 91 protein [Suhomyces tanzawaensis NRRL Y-17324]|uniref:Glycosyltransferase family 91 protein n=1 Tax=Suhomyces tanzawaensis NRRL Y-17324 TaxID=984487 RepID=A0A1E4SCA5_9ASCO|nr:glycosyltransferase family 91 protein [Suhomyces tanzawaensis NRRL Y-17324]ODV77106.1 glycosyltransferase family 91 protein [Suhomyces tanzawaensis NRRL Y-17324]
MTTFTTIKIKIRHSLRYIVAAALVSTLLLAFHLIQYDNEAGYVEQITPAYEAPPSSKSGLLILPADSLQFLDEHPEILENLGNPPIVHVETPIPEPLTPEHSLYRDHVLNIYDSIEPINLDKLKCDVLNQQATVQIDKAAALKVSLPRLMEELLKEIDTNPDGYMGQIAPFFEENLRLMVKHNVVDIFWSRLAGSSVWLKDYGVHFVISRIIYTPKAVRNQPVFSVVYAQLYDENWEEITDSHLVVPSNEGSFNVMKFPSFLPIPFFHDVDDPKLRYYGPEDAHVSLVKNKAGYEEPLLVYNSYHRKFTQNPKYDPNSKAGRKQAGTYRSMFVSWPFQLQKGKANTDGEPNKAYDDKLYSKAMELQIANQPRQKKQKNWVPLVSHSEREEHGYDRDLYFVYRWSKFETLKCDISEGTGLCSSDFKLDPKLDPKTTVGPLRGGTQMVNINELIKTQTKVDLASIIPKGREIWAGFPRAHLDDCGCGDRMYRPNLVVLVKDSIEVDRDGNKEIKSFYRITHISSSVSFDIPILSWDIGEPKKLCYISNVLIPNGIATWKAEDLHQDESGYWKVDDQMTLMVSVADFTVHNINIQGLLEQILNFNSPTLVLHADNTEQTDEGRRELGLLDPNRFSDDAYRATMGYNDDNVQCAIEGSKKFCKVYGQTYKKTFKNTASDFEEFMNENSIHMDPFQIDEYLVDLKKMEKGEQ